MGVYPWNLRKDPLQVQLDAPEWNKFYLLRSAHMKIHNNCSPGLIKYYFETLFYYWLSQPFIELLLMCIFRSNVVKREKLFFVIGLYDDSILFWITESNWSPLVLLIAGNRPDSDHHLDPFLKRFIHNFYYTFLLKVLILIFTYNHALDSYYMRNY